MLRLPAGLQACQLALSARTVWARCPNGDLARRYGVTDRNPAGDYWKKIPGHVTCFTGRCRGAGAPVDGVGGALAGGWGGAAPTGLVHPHGNPSQGHTCRGPRSTRTLPGSRGKRTGRRAAPLKAGEAEVPVGGCPGPHR